MPAFRQELTIGEDLARLREAVSKVAEAFEIIIVVDGAVDRTAELAQHAAGPETRIEILPKNRGKGFAIRHGLGKASGAVVGFIDAGMDIDPSAIGVAARLVAEGQADVVVGSKRHPQSVVNYPLRRRIYSWGYQLLCRTLFGLHVRDTQVGMKIMSGRVAADVIPSLQVDGFSFDIEMLALAHRRGFRRIEECPVKLSLEFASSVRTSTAVRMLMDTLRVFFRMRIQRMYDLHSES